MNCSRVLSVYIQATGTSLKGTQGLVWRVAMSPRARCFFFHTHVSLDWHRYQRQWHSVVCLNKWRQLISPGTLPQVPHHVIFGCLGFRVETPPEVPHDVIFGCLGFTGRV